MIWSTSHRGMVPVLLVGSGISATFEYRYARIVVTATPASVAISRRVRSPGMVGTTRGNSSFDADVFALPFAVAICLTPHVRPPWYRHNPNACRSIRFGEVPGRLAVHLHV